MRFRIASVVLMVALLVGSSSSAVKVTGKPDAKCVSILPFGFGRTVQLCLPSIVRASSEHIPLSHTSAKSLFGTSTFLPLVTHSQMLVSEVGLTPFPTAPACPSHNNHQFHTLWDGSRGCHFDHEHGQNPFTAQVATTFPGLNLSTLLGGVGVGHTNPSSPLENTNKHGGMKWQVLVNHPHGCEGFEGSPIGVNASAIQYHAFGNYAVEFDARVHSALALLRQCVTDNPNDYGYLYVVQHVDYGQRVVPYQGSIMPYQDTPNPAYAANLGPYFTTDCVGAGTGCRQSRTDVLRHNYNANSIWTSDPANLVGTGSSLFELLFRVRDTYQLLNSADQIYPFTFDWLCSNDGGTTYSQIVGCRYNNSTTRVHEINGTIPAAWDNLAGFDFDDRLGRITATGFVTRFGDLAPTCTAAGANCFPIMMVRAFVGYYGSHLIPNKDMQFSIEAQPERDIYFCGGRLCLEGTAGATASGWIGPNN